jgi:hypothetical protein
LFVGCYTNNSIDIKRPQQPFKLFKHFPESPILDLNPMLEVSDIKQSLIKFNCTENSAYLYENKKDSFAVFFSESKHLSHLFIYLKGHTYLSNSNNFLNYLASHSDKKIGGSVFSELYNNTYNFKLTYFNDQNVIRLHYFYGSDAFK